MSWPRIDESGFTLLEVLISLMVLVGGMVSVLALFTTSVAIHRSAVDDARTALIAEEVLDRIRFRWEETGDPSGLELMEFADPDFHPYEIATEIRSYSGSGEGGPLAVAVVLSWKRGQGSRSARFETVIKRDGFGPSLQALKNRGGP